MTSTQVRRLLDGEVGDHQDIASLSLCLISVLHLWGPDQYRNHNKQLLPSNISYNVDIEFWLKI